MEYYEKINHVYVLISSKKFYSVWKLRIAFWKQQSSVLIDFHRTVLWDMMDKYSVVNG